VSTAAAGALLSAAVCVLASPYLARLTLSVPDRENRRWWRGRPANLRRMGATAAAGLLLGALAGAAGGWTAALPAFTALAVLATPLVIIDLEHHRLPDRLVAPAAGSAVALLAVAAAVGHRWPDYARGLGGSIAVLVVLLLLAVLPGGGFGLGDVKLGAVLGLYLGMAGWATVFYGIFAGFVLGTLVALPLLVTGRATRKTAVPFGPLMVLGALAVLAFDLVPHLT
jgi:leader peptidase (prepilin peptidase)/N-methyltransferase